MANGSLDRRARGKNTENDNPGRAADVPFGEMAEAARPRRWLYAAAWLPFVTIYIAVFVANRVPLGLAARNAVANVLPDALLGLVVLRLPDRIPWSDRSPSRFLALHAAALSVFIAASLAGWLSLIALDGMVFDGVPRVRIDARVVPFRMINDLLIYGALAGLAYARREAAQTRELAIRADRAETLRARAELQAMRRQLNPHFILNTLHALLGLVRRDPALAEEAVERLGDLLRYAVRVEREGIDEVALRDEAAFVRSYLEIERLRLRDRLRVVLETPESSLECLVPTFSLQTLAENAVRHAIAPRPAGGRLGISAVREDGRLRLVVEDDGPGPDGPATDGGGLGLRLLRDRVAALHGGAGSVRIERKSGGGTRATIDLPAAGNTGGDA